MILLSITTIKGTVDKSKLGKVYMHEHLSIDLSGVKQDLDTRFDDIDKVIEEMKILKDKGVGSIVEVTNRGMGRDIEAMKKVTDMTGLHVIASTGFYKEPFLPEYVYKMDEKELAKLLIKDVKEGMDGTDIKAHVIGEVGTSKDKITPMEEKVLTTAALAHTETGNPISTHTTLGTMALEQIQLFKEYGVNLSKVVIGHLDLKCDLDYHLAIADTGCYLAFDTVGKINYQPDEKRIEHIIALMNRGYMEQIVLSEDITRKSHLKVNGGIGYSYLLDNFIPRLMEAGVTEEQIRHMMVYNPSKLLDV